MKACVWTPLSVIWIWDVSMPLCHSHLGGAHSKYCYSFLWSATWTRSLTWTNSYAVSFKSFIATIQLLVVSLCGSWVRWRVSCRSGRRCITPFAAPWILTTKWRWKPPSSPPLHSPRNPKHSPLPSLENWRRWSTDSPPPQKWNSSWSGYFRCVFPFWHVHAAECNL